MTAYCPYNPAHIMPIDSLLKHLTRCTATNKHEFGQCKYNQLHVLPKEMLDKHHLECPDNKKKNMKKFEDDDDWNIGMEGSSVVDYDSGDHPQQPSRNTGKRNTRPSEPVQQQKYSKDRNYDQGRHKGKKQSKKQVENWGSDSGGQIEQVGSKIKLSSKAVTNQKASKYNENKKKQQVESGPFQCDSSRIEMTQANRKEKGPVLEDF